MMMSQKILSIGRRLGRADILFWTLPYMMILLVAGTIAQKTMGLYEAQKLFFSSFVFVWNGIPFPGGYTALAVMTLNLICKFLFLSPWVKAKAGIHLIHLAVIILLVGGLITATTMTEGFIALKEGESGNVIEDYNKRVLTLQTGENIIFEKPLYDLEKTTYPFDDFTLTMTQICTNTAIRPRDDLDQENGGIGAALMAELVCIDPFVENERNIAGITYRVSGAGDKAQNGRYIAFEGRQTQDDIMGVTVRVDREKRELPFAVTLQALSRDIYPGTNMASDYESRVTIEDGAVTWPAAISMNEPLRYGGYTFYQASTLVDPQDGREVSVLSVVVNQGMIFPYISGILLAIGLVMHMVMCSRKR